MFIPTTQDELKTLGWSTLDIILVTGDSYIDSPYIGAAVIGRVLIDAGFKVGIIAQPGMNTSDDICRLGEPNLFWGVSGGSIDSMVANYTALKKKRKSDDYTPGGVNNRRPDRAVIAYTNLIKRFFKSSRPIVLGGIEASLRRIAHYDFWSNKIRKSILFDAKADFLVYGMAEKTIVSLAEAMRSKNSRAFYTIPGLCYIAKEPRKSYEQLADFETVKKSNDAFIQSFQTFYRNNDPLNATGLVQRQDNRYLIQNPPSPHLSQDELDKVYELKYQNEVHPYYAKYGKVKALDTIRFSITSHRGCYGECNFCAIALHQGRTIIQRSNHSIEKEVKRLTTHPKFKGIISDIGGPTANMFGIECKKKLKKGSCTEKKCLSPKVCQSLTINHNKQLEILDLVSRIPKVRKVFIASGIRYDMILADKQLGLKYLMMVIKNHVSGQLKIAPEHSEPEILSLMGKPDVSSLLQFKELFYKYTKKIAKQQFLTYYFIAAHPGCTKKDMHQLKKFCSTQLRTVPQQTQIFTPTPSTFSSLMYHTEKNPWTLKRIFVEKDPNKKNIQKQTLVNSGPR